MATDESDIYAMVLGRIIATLRERRGMTQSAFARQIGMAQSTLSRIERGQVLPDYYTFRRFAAALGMTVEQLDAKVNEAYERTRVAAGGSRPSGSQGAPWWIAALGIAGLVGLAGLIAFAVAAVLEDDNPV